MTTPYLGSPSSAQARFIKKRVYPFDSEVAWLESTGTQWIDTGLWSTENTQVNCVMSEGTLIEGTDYTGRVTGNSINGYGHSWTYVIYSHNAAGYFFWTGGTHCNGEFIQCTMDSSRNIYVNGMLVGQSCISGYETVQTQYTRMYVFAGLVGGTITPAKLKVKSFSIIQNGVLVRDFIPVVFTNEQGVSEGAMYDKVSRKLFRNQGTGSFKIGPNVITSTVDQYAQEGLIAMWDGIENVGAGLRDENSLVWKDITVLFPYDLSVDTCAWNEKSLVNNISSNCKLLDKVIRGSLYDWYHSNGIFSEMSGTQMSIIGDYTIEVVMIASDQNSNVFIPWNASQYMGFSINNPWNSRRLIFSPANGWTAINQYNGFIFNEYAGKPIVACGIAKATGGSTLYVNGLSASTSLSAASIRTYDDRYATQVFVPGNGALYAIRIYNRALTVEEMKHNCEVDTQRFIWKNPYVTDGLIAMWDGEWNAAPNVHINQLSVWHDLTFNGNDATIVKSEEYSKSTPFDANSARMDGTFAFSFTPSQQLKDAVSSDITIECTCKLGTPSLTDSTPFFNLGTYYTGAMSMSGAANNMKFTCCTNNEVHWVTGGSGPFENFAVTKHVDGNNVTIINYSKGEYKQTTSRTFQSRAFGESGNLFGTTGNFFGGKGRYWDSGIDGYAYALRVYNRALTSAEIAKNYEVDKQRFIDYISPPNYVTNGLIAHWDGIDNNGKNSHDSSATAWKDLTNGIMMDIDPNNAHSGWCWAENGLSTIGRRGGTTNPWGQCLSVHANDIMTIETVLTIDKSSSSPIPFAWSFGTKCLWFKQDIDGMGESTASGTPVWQILSAFTNEGTTTRGTFTLVYGLSSSSTTSRYFNAISAGIDTGYRDNWVPYSDDSFHLSYKNNAKWPLMCTFHSIRMYNRALTQEEVIHNHAIDKSRFGL